MSKETQFIQLPAEKELKSIDKHGVSRKLKEDEYRLLHQYRDPTQKQMNITLKVLSVIPRVFEIKNFLSQVEVSHIIKLAGGIELALSRTGEGGSEKVVKDTTKTRTSLNSWMSRENSPILDAIYRRSADLLRIDESLLRFRDKDEFVNITTKHPLSEQLQLVHYENRQEYTAHHDFGYSKIDNTNSQSKQQGARFATLLLYLNDQMIGGETAFPRWVNGETFRQLKVKPEIGKAVLFYSQLPDGNLDDFSQHAALPVTDGEKVRYSFFNLFLRKKNTSCVDIHSTDNFFLSKKKPFASLCFLFFLCKSFIVGKCSSI